MPLPIINFFGFIDLCPSNHLHNYFTASKEESIKIMLRAHHGTPVLSSSHEIRFNLLLAALSDQPMNRWLPQLELVEMPLSYVLFDPNGNNRYVYFPTSAIISLQNVMENGDTAEIAVIGNEGIVGISLFMGGNSTPTRAVIHSAGKGYRLRAQFMKKEFERAGPVTHLLLRYIQALMTQISQIAACNRHHSVDQQLCRSLLLSLDRLPGNELLMTQELIANSLGVRREGVTESAVRLQKAGLIRYSRGHITILDRKELENRVCECYSVVQHEYDRLLPLEFAE